MNSLKLNLDKKELYKLNDFIKEVIGKEDFQVELICEEIFVNIVEYSNTDFVKVNTTFENSTLTIEFIDNGIEFNPLLNENPKLPDTIEEAKIGGLGIFLTKNVADELKYYHKNNENHLIITKKID